MHNNTEIDNEIRRFLELNPSPTKEKEEKPEVYNKNKFKNLLSTLKELQRAHDDIKKGIETRSDVNVINKNLTELLKAIIDERKNKEEEIDEKSKTIKKLENKIEDIEREITKKENCIKYDKTKKEEMNRMFKDQKERLLEYKNKFETLTKSFESTQLINKELEAINEREKTKNEYLENQMNLFGGYLKEKEKEIEQCKINNQECLQTVENLKSNSKTLLENNDALQHKLEEKENTINILNSEINTLIMKENNKIDFLKDAKEKSEYYERLYKSVSKQNEYLNNELAKMINIKNIDYLNKEEESQKINEEELNEKFENLRLEMNHEIENNKKLAKKKTKKVNDLYNQKIIENDKLIMENNKSKEKIFELANEIKLIRLENEKSNENYKRLNEKLFLKIENLITCNKELQETIYRLKKENFGENDKKNILSKVEYNQTDNEFFETKKHFDAFKKPFTIEKNVFKDTDKYFFKNASLENYYDVTQNNDINKNDSFKSFIDLNEIKDSTRYASPVNNHSYEDLRDAKRLREYIENEEIENPFLSPKKENTRKSTNEEFRKNFTRNDKLYDNQNEKRESNDEFFNLQNQMLDKDSASSTTSSLKNMIKKTDNLKERFNDLEIQLKNIQKPKSRINTPKIKNTNNKSYFLVSDGIDLDNNSDVL
ncbi:hypothetical protein GVAV_003045 [Gurleya vavrai]